MAEAEDRPALATNGGIEDLSDDLKIKLDAAYEEFERVSREDGGAAAYEVIAAIVGPLKMNLAASHLASIRVARMRAAAKSNGFNIGV